MVKSRQKEPLTDLGRVAHREVAYEGCKVGLSCDDNFNGLYHEQITHYLSAGKVLFCSLFSFWLDSRYLFLMAVQVTILVFW